MCKVIQPGWMSKLAMISSLPLNSDFWKRKNTSELDVVASMSFQQTTRMKSHKEAKALSNRVVEYSKSKSMFTPLWNFIAVSRWAQFRPSTWSRPWEYQVWNKLRLFGYLFLPFPPHLNAACDESRFPMSQRVSKLRGRGSKIQIQFLQHCQTMACVHVWFSDD